MRSFGGYHTASKFAQSSMPPNDAKPVLYAGRYYSTNVEFKHLTKVLLKKNSRAMAKKDYIFSDQMTMFGSKEIIGFGDTEFCVKEIDRNHWP